MQAHTPRRLIALTRSKVSAGSSAASRGRDLDAGVVERHVEPPEGVDGRVHHGGHAVLVGDVAGDAERLVAGGGQLVGGGLEGGLVDVGQDDRGSGFGEGAAVARPMPELAPVTRATCPAKS